MLDVPFRLFLRVGLADRVPGGHLHQRPRRNDTIRLLTVRPAVAIVSRSILRDAVCEPVCEPVAEPGGWLLLRRGFDVANAVQFDDVPGRLLLHGRLRVAVRPEDGVHRHGPSCAAELLLDDDHDCRPDDERDDV